MFPRPSRRLVSGAENKKPRRSAEYAVFQRDVAETRRSLGAAEADVEKQLKRVKKDFEAIQAMDFFHNEASVTGAAALQEFVALANKVLSPGVASRGRRCDPSIAARGLSGPCLGDTPTSMLAHYATPLRKSCTDCRSAAYVLILFAELQRVFEMPYGRRRLS